MNHRPCLSSHACPSCAPIVPECAVFCSHDQLMTRPLDLPSSHSSPNTLIELYLLYFYLLLLYLLFLYLLFPLPPRSIMSEVSAASPEPPATATASASPFLVIQDHSLWHDGDFVLMSSDGWRFRVLSHHLFSARYDFQLHSSPHHAILASSLTLAPSCATHPPPACSRLSSRTKCSSAQSSSTSP